MTEKQKLHIERLARLPRTKKFLEAVRRIRKPNAKKVGKCKTCNNEYVYYISTRTNPLYCSRKCQNNSPERKKLSQKNGMANRGKKIGSNNPNWKKGKSSLLNTIRTMTKMRAWVLDIFRRDNFTCQKCGDNKGGNLNAHHKKWLSKMIEEFNIKNVSNAYKCKELWNLNNGITLCIKCHGKEHKRVLRGRG